MELNVKFKVLLFYSTKTKGGKIGTSITTLEVLAYIEKNGQKVSKIFLTKIALMEFNFCSLTLVYIIILFCFPFILSYLQFLLTLTFIFISITLLI